MRLIRAVLCVYANWRQSQLIQTSHNNSHLFSGQCGKTILAIFIHHKICVTNQNEDVMSLETCFSLCLKREDESVEKGQLQFCILDLAFQTYATIALKFKVLFYNKVLRCRQAMKKCCLQIKPTELACSFVPDQMVIWCYDTLAAQLSQ